MPTKQSVKDKRIVASQKRLEALQAKVDRHKDAISDLQADLNKEKAHLEWLKAMPAEPDAPGEPESASEQGDDSE